MNARTITSFTLAIGLTLPAAFAGEGLPFTGPNQPIMTTASNDAATRYGRDSVYVQQGSIASRHSTSENSNASNDPVPRYGRDSIYVQQGSVAARRNATSNDKTLEVVIDAPIDNPKVFGRS
jgi:hypothetical protein